LVNPKNTSQGYDEADTHTGFTNQTADKITTPNRNKTSGLLGRDNSVEELADIDEHSIEDDTSVEGRNTKKIFIKLGGPTQN
jgi:hypothetical protein